MSRIPSYAARCNSCAVFGLLVLFSVLFIPVMAHADAVFLTDHASGFTGQDFGAAVCGLGDIDGDGNNDLLVGAPGDNSSGSEAGAAFLWYGNSAVTHSANEVWYGVAGEKFGYSVAAIGDVNNDGNPDFAVGAPLSNTGGTGKGRVCIFYGGSFLSPTPDLIILGANGGDQFGFSVAAAGDFNGDGKDDFIVGAPYSNTGGTNIGAAYVIYGNTGDPSTDLVDATTLTGEIGGDFFGWSVCPAGNFLGGNEVSVAVGAPGNDSHWGLDAGAVHIFKGSLFPATPDATADHLIGVGGTSQAGSQYGWVVRNAGRWDNVAYDDLAVGAPTNNQAGSAAGRVEIIFGGLSPSTTGDRYATGSSGGDNLGYALAPLGDFTNSGRDDILIGAPFYAGDGTDAGRAYIYEGNSSSGGVSVLAAIVVDPLMPSTQAFDRFGFAVAGTGDFDGDGFMDYAVAAPSGNIANNAPAGFCRLWATDNQTVATFRFQAVSTWTDDGQVQLRLILPVAPEDIVNLEIRRQGAFGQETVFDGPVEDLVVPGFFPDGEHHYQLIDAGPFDQGIPDRMISYQATLNLRNGGMIELSDPYVWEPLSLEQQPALRPLMARQAWPNPANPRSALEYKVAQGLSYSLTIADIRGRRIRQLVEGRGTGQWEQKSWDGKDDLGRALPSGLYLFRLRTNGHIEIRKVILAR